MTCERTVQREEDDRRPNEGEGFGECAPHHDVEGEVGRGHIDHGSGEARRVAPPLADEPVGANAREPYAQEKEELEGRRVNQPEAVQADEQVRGEWRVIVEVRE